MLVSLVLRCFSGGLDGGECGLHRRGFRLPGELGFESKHVGGEGGVGFVDIVALGGDLVQLGLRLGEARLEFFPVVFEDPLALPATLGAGVVGLGGCDEAERGLVDDDLDWLFGRVVGKLLGQRGGGDLQAVEQDAATARIDAVHGDGVEHVGDGGQDGGAVLGPVEHDLAAALPALDRVLDRLAGGVVVVAEGLRPVGAAQRGRLAAAAVGEDVPAAVAKRRGCPGGECLPGFE